MNLTKIIIILAMAHQRPVVSIVVLLLLAIISFADQELQACRLLECFSPYIASPFATINSSS